jgi:hypothetical protein
MDPFLVVQVLPLLAHGENWTFGYVDPGRRSYDVVVTID